MSEIQQKCSINFLESYFFLGLLKGVCAYLYCGNIHTHPLEGHWNFWEEYEYETKLEFLIQTKIISMEQLARDQI